MWIFVFCMLFNGGTVPWYITMKNYGLMDSIWGLVLGMGLQVFNVILAVNFFKNLPVELEEARPDGIICANNYIAYGCVNALHHAQIEIPTDIKVITFDDYPFSQILKPQLTVVNIDMYDMGIQAGKYILQKIRKPNLYAQSYITIPTLIVRQST